MAARIHSFMRRAREPLQGPCPFSMGGEGGGIGIGFLGARAGQGGVRPAGEAGHLHVDTGMV